MLGREIREVNFHSLRYRRDGGPLQVLIHWGRSFVGCMYGGVGDLDKL